jgi:hypothetical protein
MTHDPHHPIARWHAIAAARDPSALPALLADDVVFVSPVVHTPQKGRAITVAYLSAALQVFGNETFRYVREVVGPSDAMLEFETTVDGVLVNGVDIIRWDGQGRITEFKVMVRPLKGMQAIHARMAAMLQQMQEQK